ncbi:MAG: zinc ribbon domain-containing protein [Betaproteobacteria bacterium]|nr:MAG: zinc ribbon domain-containing protein [Betaproteobacteria bacterium]
MNCARCQHENPYQARFYMECGAPLSLTCSKCGTELPPAARFCFVCGQVVITNKLRAKQSVREILTPHNTSPIGSSLPHCD